MTNHTLILWLEMASISGMFAIIFIAIKKVRDPAMLLFIGANIAIYCYIMDTITNNLIK